MSEVNWDLNIQHSINPVYEAKIYLMQRFATLRTGDRVLDQLRRNKNNLPNQIWECCGLIRQLETELDERYKNSSIISYYFSPLQVRDSNQLMPLTLGGVLLEIPFGQIGSYSLDSIENFYQDASSEQILLHAVRSPLFEFVQDRNRVCKNLYDFIALVDEVLVSIDDKWKLTDIITNPLKHFSVILPLVNEVAAYIEQQSKIFAPLVNECLAYLCSDDDCSLRFSELGLDIDPIKYDSIIITPTVFLFNGIGTHNTDDGRVFIFLGIFVSTVFVLRTKQVDIEKYLPLLKVLSDGTRLKALCEMRDRYSYGQELAERCDSSRNAMYYHLDKLFGYGLVDCMLTDYKSLYIMNKRNVYDKLTALRDFLVGGWTPEDGEAEPEDGEEEPEDREDQKAGS